MRFSTLAASFVALAASAIASPALIARDAIVIAGTPDYFTTCTKYTFTWEGGDAPYNVRIYQNTGGLFADILTDNKFYTWDVVANGGKEVYLSLTSANEFASSPLVPVVNGTDTSCIRCAGYLQYKYC